MFFFFNDTATTEIYTLSLHDALPISELEFIAFRTSYEDAANGHYRDLVPVNQYNVDYSILGGSRAEPLLRDLRNHLYAAGLDVESAKRSEEHTSELQSRQYLVCRLLLEKKKPIFQ